MKSAKNPAGGETIEVLTEASETDGEYSTVRVTAPAHLKGVPAHFHREYDEHIKVLEGTLHVKDGGKTRSFRSGEECVFTRDQVHRWWTEDEGVVFEVCSRPGFDGFQEGINMLQNMQPQGLLNSEGIPQNPYHLAAVSSVMKTQVRGALTPLALFTEFLGRTSKGKKVKKELRQKYCAWKEVDPS